MNMTLAQYAEAEKAGKGMALAAAYGKITLEKFETAAPFVNQLGGAYKANYDKKVQETREVQAKAENDNKKIYYEADVPTSECPKADPQNFVNLVSVADELNKVPDLDEKLRHLVPPAVNSMQEELRSLLQGLI